MRKKSKLTYGVGINDADYVVQRFESWQENGKQFKKLVWKCPYYVRWKCMLTRCYSVKFQEDNPTYKDCHVCEEWLIFSRFKKWMKAQAWEGMELDKDILVNANREYSPSKCVFIHKKVNQFLTERGADRGRCSIGVYFLNVGKGKQYRASCSNPFKNTKECLGYYTTEQEAHEAYKRRKYELAIELANSEYVTDDRVRKALIDRFKPLPEPKKQSGEKMEPIIIESIARDKIGLVEIEASFSVGTGKISIESTFLNELSKIRLKDEGGGIVYSLDVVGDVEQHSFSVNSDVETLRSIAKSFQSLNYLKARLGLRFKRND